MREKVQGRKLSFLCLSPNWDYFPLLQATSRDVWGEEGSGTWGVALQASGRFSVLSWVAAWPGLVVADAEAPVWRGCVTLSAMNS